jgi:NADPH2:quinone reductase
MKAIQITSYDGPDGLSYGEFPEPVPGPGQVSQNVEFAGANYVEALFADGFVANPLPWVPGIEAVGRVKALGEGVTGVTVGDCVAALTINDGGGYGQVARLLAALRVVGKTIFVHETVI